VKQNLASILLVAGCLDLPVGAAGAKPDPLPAVVKFNRDIRPILSDNCYACHGPDKDKRKAKLRLDTQAGALADLGGHSAIVPGKLANSELYRRITTKDADDLMPPLKSGRKLSGRDVQLLRRWIEQGAKWQPHWAFIPPSRPALPAVKNANWPVTPADRFILARLEKEGLRPSAGADPRTLIRRLSFDLTGLPPRPDEVEAFVRDTSEQAYERLVDRLLASPHYGERMAMHWLDLVRYADTDGFHADNYRSVFPYRDYVISAFSHNLPFDRFTTEQIAGDLLPGATLEQKVASTYNRLNRTTEEGGSQAKEYLAKYAADRVRTTSGVWMGATLGCAECHDHKFDPYTTRDFYRFGAFFADIKEVGVGKPEGSLVPSEEQSAELKRFDGAIAEQDKKLRTPTEELAQAQAQWEKKTLSQLNAGTLGWVPLKPEKVVSKAGATLTVQDDLSVLANGTNADNDTYTVTLQTDRPHITAVRLEALIDASHDKQSLSRGGGNFVLTAFEVKVAGQGKGEGRAVSITNAIADYSQKDYPVSAALDAKAETGWAVDGQKLATNRQAAFIFGKPLAGGTGTTLTVVMKHDSKFKRHNIGRFRLSVISVDQPALTEHGLPAAVFEALRAEPAERSTKQKEALSKHYLSFAPELDPVRQELAATRKQRDDFVKSIPTTLMAVAVEPRTMRILRRGNWLDDSGEVVTPATPQFLSSAEDKERRATRADLAKWIVARENPLTARVFVNRLWKLYFGTGLSKNLDDVGAQGEWAKHPELLDWLAVEFMDRGWDVKHMVKLMVMSSTYRQTSTVSQKLREKDPDNRLHARQARFRLDAEMVRDNALATSGLLVDKVGGPSAKPYQPAGYWAYLNFPKREWQNDQGEGLYRRGLYTYWCRTYLHPSLVAFDASTREECAAARVRSNTPQQALALLNDPTYVEAARVFAERLIRDGGKDAEQRIQFACRLALSRPARPEEITVFKGLLAKHRQEYTADPKSADELLNVGAWPKPKDIEAVELAAWTSVTRTILNLHETITRF
jgi:hypothetical protein